MRPLPLIAATEREIAAAFATIVEQRAGTLLIGLNGMVLVNEGKVEAGVRAGREIRAPIEGRRQDHHQARPDQEARHGPRHP
jgi:hypothetical protein